MRVRRARTSCETSLTILALSLGARVVNHLARRYWASAKATGIQGEVPTTLPCRESRMRYLLLLVIDYIIWHVAERGAHFIVMVAGEKRCRCVLGDYVGSAMSTPRVGKDVNAPSSTPR